MMFICIYLMRSHSGHSLCPKADSRVSRQLGVATFATVRWSARLRRRGGDTLAVLRRDLHLFDEVFGFAEAGAGHSLVLRIDQYDPLAGIVEYLPGDRFVANRELEFFRYGPRHRDQHEFTFPRLAEPPLFRKLLDVAGAFPVGVGP